MKPVSLVLTCAVIALISLACNNTETITNSTTPSRTASPAAAASPAAPADEFATARLNYAKHCEACHGPQGEGGPVKTPEKQIKVPSLKAPHAVRHSDEELIKIVTNGEEEMPSFKDKLNAEEITTMVRFVRKNFQGK
ncbi:MAG TPA: cytochrome c [Pyrinomonadaceae bacterium]|nr:cytochrome c [Pyrinomonadaceae bacterium]